MLVDWVAIAGESDARDAARRIREAPRAFMGRTSISAAIDFGVNQLDRSPFQAPRKVINVSGELTNNSGREITRARDDALARNLTINGLAILSQVPLATIPTHTDPPGGLTAYYENNDIGGPGAFVVEAQNFEAFGQVLIGKLIRTLPMRARQGPVTSHMVSYGRCSYPGRDVPRAQTVGRAYRSKLFIPQIKDVSYRAIPWMGQLAKILGAAGRAAHGGRPRPPGSHRLAEFRL